jgi:hypothetical protein
VGLLARAIAVAVEPALFDADVMSVFDISMMNLCEFL